jgi:uncharacterized protein
MTPPTLRERFDAGRTDLVIDLLDASAGAAELPALLAHCAYHGDVTALRLVLARGARLTALGADLGLNAAAFHGHWALCEFLLSQGANARHADAATGETALHAAMTNEDRLRHDLVAALLLRAGANPNAATVAGAATGAFMRDARTRGETPLHRAAAFGTPATLRLLLDAGADPTRRDANGDTPLAWASWHRRPVEVLRLLLHGEHRIHPDWQPMRANLVGRPL